MTIIALFLHLLVQIVLILRVLVRSHRDPESRIAWLVVIIAFPLVGILGYILFGETNIGLRRVARMNKILSQLPVPISQDDAKNIPLDIPQNYAHLFRVGKTVNGFNPVGGNRARLMPDSNATMDSIVADIDAAKDHVHVLFLYLAT